MAALNELIQKIENPELRAQIQEAANRLVKQKKFGLVFEEHLPECTPLYDIPVRKGLKVSVHSGKASETYTVLAVADGKALCLPKNRTEAVEFAIDDLVTTAELGDPIYPCLQPLGEVCNAPDSDLWHTLIEADNYHALQLLEYLYAGKVDCIYIDPPYNTGARDWKYNNDYVDGSDEYRHSKWLSFMQKRLEIAKKLLNPKNSVLIVAIDDVEVHNLYLLLQQVFPNADCQVVTTVINPSGKTGKGFSVVNEYLIFVYVGEFSLCNLTSDMLFENEKKSTTESPLSWESLLRRGSSWTPAARPNLFYPILVDKNTNRIVGVGEPADPSQDLPKSLHGCFAAWPIKNDGSFAIWRVDGKKLISLAERGYALVSRFDKKRDTYAFKYLMSGDISRIDSGVISVVRDETTGVVKAISEYQKKKTPKSVWNVSSHNAGMSGSDLLTDIIGRRGFTYPKSLYAVLDTLRFAVQENQNALIVDFFAGSGTTLHAVNLLNAEDGGHRRCIMVTNNEVSNDEAKTLTEQGYHPGDDAWEKLGIARYVTWPRTACSIEGHDINGNSLTGNYIGGDRPMADGFETNAVFFKLSFLDKTKVSLGMQFKELLSTLWMKAGAIGKCPTIDAGVPDMLILPNNKMAILNDENLFGVFAEQLAQHPEVEVVYLVTDYESSFVAMTQVLEGKKTYQLYRDYLDNFRINAGRNSR